MNAEAGPPDIPGTKPAVTLVLAAVAALVTWRLLHPDFVHLLWADRDLVRTLDVLEGRPPVAGAELNYGRGARIPGGFQYLALALPLMISKTAAAAYRFVLLLDLAATALLGWLVGRRWGVLAGAFAVGAYALADASTDTLRQLWNPAMTGLPVVATLLACVRVVEERDARWLPAGVVATALGAQCHLSAGLVGGALLVATVLTRPRGLLRHGALATLLGLACYAPYLLAESRSGWPNTALLRVPQHTADLEVFSDPRPRDLRNLWGLLTLLAERQSAGRLFLELRAPALEPLAGVAGAGAVLALLLGLGSIRWRAPEDRSLRVVAAVTLAVAGYFVLSRSVQLDVTTQRYLLAWMPLPALVGGVGVARAARALAARSRPAAAGLVGLLAVGLAVRGMGAVTVVGFDDAGLQVSGVRTRIFEAARAHLGTDIADLASRTVVLRKRSSDDASWFASPVDGVAFELRSAGLVFPGSRTGSCLAVLPYTFHLGSEPATMRQAILAALGPWVGDVQVESVESLDEWTRLVRYRAGDEPCRSSLVNRYVLLPEEELAQRLEPGLRPGEVRTLPSPEPGVWRVLVAIPAPVPDGLDTPDPRMLGVVPAILDLRREGDGAVSATLHANQLRGHAYNDRFFLDAMLDRPRLELTAADGTTAELPLAPGLTGMWGALTPLHARRPAPAGPLQVRFVADRLRDVDLATWPPATLHRLPFRADLGTLPP